MEGLLSEEDPNNTVDVQRTERREGADITQAYTPYVKIPGR